MLLLWMFLISLLLILDIYCERTDTVIMKENWRGECIYNFPVFSQAKSIGILYKDDASFHSKDFFKSIADNGITSEIFELPAADFNDLVKTIKWWKSVGIHHILFLQRMDAKLLYLWMKILSEICDDTWWLFYAEEASRNMFETNLANRKCLTNRWIVFSTNCSLCPKYNESLNREWYANVFDSPTKDIYHTATKNSENLLEEPKSSRPLIRLAVNESPPYLIANINENGDVILVNGPEVELLKTMSEKFGFEYKILRSPDGEWGRKRNGNWTGLIGMLARGEADIASGCVTVTYQRYLASSFSFPYDIQRSVIISRIPGVMTKTYAVLLPFTYDVWLMVLFLLLSFLFLLYGVGKMYEILYFNKPYKLDRIFWYMIGTICSEGGWLTFQIQGPVTVLLLGLWLSFVFVMQASYCGTLMSVLTFPTYEPAIDTLSDLASAVVKEGYKCGCLKGTINCDTLLDLSEDLKVIADTLNSDNKNFVSSVHDGLSKVLEEKFAFLAQEIGSIYRAQLMPEPNFYMSSDGLDIELFSFAVRSGLPYLKDIDNMILRLLEAGLIAKWRDDIISLNNMKFDTRKREVSTINPVSLQQLTGAIYMFSYGLLFAFIALVYECIRGKCFNKSRI